MAPTTSKLHDGVDDLKTGSGSSHRVETTPASYPNSNSITVSDVNTSWRSVLSTSPHNSLSSRRIHKNHSGRFAKVEAKGETSKDEGSLAEGTLQEPSTSSNSCSARLHHTGGERNGDVAPVSQMSPPASLKMQLSSDMTNVHNREESDYLCISTTKSEINADLLAPATFEEQKSPISTNVCNSTPQSHSKRGSIGDKISDQVSKFDSISLDGALLSPMQMHASLSSVPISRLPLVGSDSEREHTPLSPLRVRTSVPAKKRSIRHKKIEMKARVFDSPDATNKQDLKRMLLSPQEVRELVKSSNTNRRLDQLLHRYEHLSEEESRERRRLAAKIAAKERRRRLGTSTATTKARLQAWEQSRARFREGFDPISLLKLEKKFTREANRDVISHVFDEVRAMSYDFSDFRPSSFPKTDFQRKLILDAIARDFPFAEFRAKGMARTNGAVDALVDAFEPVSFKPSEVLLCQGSNDGNDKFYILENGTIELQRNGVCVGQLNGVGESFGQLALMYHSTSNVTISVGLLNHNIKGNPGASLMTIDQLTYRGLLREYSQKAWKEKRQVLLGVDFLRDLLEGDEVLIQKLSPLMVRHELESYDDLDASEESTFYAVLSGIVKIFSKDGALVESLSSGGYFGEKSLIGSLSHLGRSSSVAKVVAQSASVLYTIEKKSMEQMLGKGRLENLRDMQKLNATGLVKRSRFTQAVRDRMVDSITLRESDEENMSVLTVDTSQRPTLHVVREGGVLVSNKDAKCVKDHSNEVKSGARENEVQKIPGSDGTESKRVGGRTTSTKSGEIASIADIPLEEAESEKYSPAKSKSHSFQSTMIKSQMTPVTLSNHKWIGESTAMQLRKKLREAVWENLVLDNLEKIRLLGEGEFGEVWMVAADVFGTGVPEQRQNFALKSQFRKDITRGKDATTDIMREIEMLKEIDHPQVVEIFNTFEDHTSIHILMGLIPGGELWDVIHTEDENGDWISGLPEEHTKFVTMVVTDTLDFIHSKGIIYRDLKPGKFVIPKCEGSSLSRYYSNSSFCLLHAEENIMIDQYGYPVLVDFGFAKHCPDKTYTFVGTPNYVAPELITNAGHNRCVDYWALGVTVYEMTTGENPFFFDGMDQVSLFQSICDEKYYPLPEGTSAALQDFVDGLLQKDTSTRLGMLANGANDVLGHVWLEELNLNLVRAKKWRVPWKTRQDDDANANEEFLKELCMTLPATSLEDSINSPDVCKTDDSTCSILDPSERDNSMGSIPEEDDTSIPSLQDVPFKAESLKRAEKKKKKTRKDSSKKKNFDPASAYQYVTPTQVTYFSIKKPNRNLAKQAKDKAESDSRRSALKGTLRNLGVDSDDDDDEMLQRFLAGKK